MSADFKRHLIFFLFPSFFTAANCSSEINSLKQDRHHVGKTFNQRHFSREEFHYLTAPRVGLFILYDLLDCTFECVRNALCLAINMAASKGANGEFWCELLSSDKYRDAGNYNENKSSYHLSFQSPCSSSPCLNGRICIPDYKYNSYDCRCEQGFVGEYCEKAVKSCMELYDVNRSDVRQLVTLRLDSKPVPVLCHMGDFGCGDGGWTPVMKIDGNKQTFHYLRHYWSNYKEYNLPGGQTGFDTQETKLPTYWNTSFSKICLGMKFDNQTNFIVINKHADSLYSLIADGQYRATSLGRNTWKKLIGSQASLQDKCEKEGFNVFWTWGSTSKARIGVIGNDKSNCSMCRSRIGFGTGGVTRPSSLQIME